LVSPGNSPSLTSSARHRVWYLYWLEGRWLIRPSEVKLRQAFSRLLGHGDDGAIVMLAAPMRDDTDATLEKFARGHLQDIEMALDRTRESRPDRPH
jgi:EpsI family protein